MSSHRLPPSALPATFLSLAWPLLAAAQEPVEPEADPSELPRIPLVEAADALATLEIRPGFRLELAAAEPLVADPIDLAFDEQGRLFVVEMRSYSERREDALCRIKLLVDEDGDGIYDRATVYAEGLKWATSVCCYDGGVFVTASPDIFYFKDTTGDGVADVQEIVFTGFGSGRDRLNMQALLNNLRWGPGNRIWGATAGNGGMMRRPDQAESEAVSVNGADFSFDPKTREFRAENGTSQFGMSFDSRGRRFVCSNSNHIQWVAWERSQAAENPFYSLPAPLVSIAPDGAAAPVFRISPDEPWRIVRTRWRVSGVVRGAVEGGGRVSGYFTSAAGITLYTGDAFGPGFRDNAFVGDVGSNLIHRKIVRDQPGSPQPVAVRAEDEQETEFIRSTDNWFRPVNFANGPDGCLYVCDMYRETIEHPWSIPEGIKKHLDLNSGWDRGRIWRVVPEGYQLPAFSLDRDNEWQRITRARLAYEREGAAAPDPYPAASAPLAGADDPLPATGDRWAVAYALNRLADVPSMASAWERRDQASPEFRAGLAEMIGKTGDRPAIAAVLDAIAQAGAAAPESERLLSALGAGLRVARLDLAAVDPEGRMGAIFSAARDTAAASAAAAAARISAVRLLAHDAAPEAGALLRQLAGDAAAPEPLRQAAIQVAAAKPGDLASTLVEQWQGLTPALRTTALDAFTSSSERAAALLGAVEGGAIPAADIPAATADLLRDHRDEAVKALAAKVLPRPVAVPREEVVERYQAALALEGDPARGKEVYTRAACITCHKTPDGAGASLGPDLVTFKNAGADSIIKNVFDPNAEVAPQYQAFIFELEGGETVLGMIDREDATEVVVRQPGGLERAFPRREVAAMKGAGSSLMPEGLEVVITEQDMADLLAYIAAAE